jgi:hypothetical protein
MTLKLLLHLRMDGERQLKLELTYRLKNDQNQFILDYF